MNLHSVFDQSSIRVATTNRCVFQSMRKTAAPSPSNNITNKFDVLSKTLSSMLRCIN